MIIQSVPSPGSQPWASQLDAIFSRCKGAYSDLTLSGYRTDLEIFAIWCSENDVGFLPAHSRSVARFFDDQLQTCRYATIRRRASAIRFAHVICDLPSPIDHSDVFLSMRRAARLKGRRPKQVLGLTRPLLDKILAACPDTLAGSRDAALLSVGYDTLCRSSELSWMQVGDVQLGKGHIYIPRAKNDPFGDGRFASLQSSTIKRLESWLAQSRIKDGPLFRGLHTRAVSIKPMDTSSTRRLIKCSARRAGLKSEAERLSDHSMRIGAAQDMLQAGHNQIAIMTAGGWKNADVLARYVERAFCKAHSDRKVHPSSR